MGKHVSVLCIRSSAGILTPGTSGRKPNLIWSASGSTSSCQSTILNDAPKPACDNRPYLTLLKCSISEAINPSQTSNNSASKNAELHNSNIWLKKILAESLFTVARMHTQYDKQARWSHKSRFGLSPEVPGIKNPTGP